MSKVLAVSGTVSPKDKSYSWELLNRFIKYYQAKHPDDELTVMDLNKEIAGTESLNGSNWDEFFSHSDKYIDQLKSVDKLIFVSPMNNFNVSALVKNYLDHVLVANKTFSYKYGIKGQAKGLLPNLTVQVLGTQGAPWGWYLFGDHMTNLRGTWDFCGCKVKTPILIAGTKSAPYNKMTPKEVVDLYDSRIKAAAEDFDTETID